MMFKKMSNLELPECAFYLFLFFITPIIGLVLRNFGVVDEGDATDSIKILYESFFAIFSLVALFRNPAIVLNFKKSALIFFIAAFIFSAIKFSFGVEGSGDFYWQPLMMEVKPLYYFFVACIIYYVVGGLKLDVVIDGICFVACLMIFGWVIKYFLLGVFDARASVIEESNYDGYLLILGILINEYLRPKYYWWRHGLISLALFLTFSRSGYMSVAIVYVLILVRNRKFVPLIGLVLISFPVAFLIFEKRFSDVDGAEDVDRIRMWLSFQDISSTASYFNNIFGFVPGYPIRYFDPFIQYFIEWQSEMQWGILGLHAFNFHSMHLRLLITWGFLGVALLYVWLIYIGMKAGFYTRLMLLLGFVQAFSMGGFYLTTLAVIIYLCFMTISQREVDKKIRGFE